MFSKSKINDPAPKPESAAKPSAPDPRTEAPRPDAVSAEFRATAPKAKPPAS
ncbi:MAG: polymer-forming cytoskeletal protein, partial [Pseudomonadota bacterium]